MNPFSETNNPLEQITNNKETKPEQESKSESHKTASDIQHNVGNLINSLQLIEDPDLINEFGYEKYFKNTIKCIQESLELFEQINTNLFNKTINNSIQALHQQLNQLLAKFNEINLINQNSNDLNQLSPIVDILHETYENFSNAVYSHESR